MLEAWPLLLKLVRRDRYARDTVFGLASLSLAKVFKTPLYYRCPESNKTFSSYAAWDKYSAGKRNFLTFSIVEVVLVLVLVLVVAVVVVVVVVVGVGVVVVVPRIPR